MAAIYRPSLYRTHDVQTPAPDPEAVEHLIGAVKSCSTRLQADPYNPEHWTERASLYLQLNYPELAVSDAYRAKLLFERADASGTEEKKTSQSEKESTEEVRISAFTVLGQALYDCHCHWECFEFWLSLTEAKQFPRLSRLAFTKANALKQLLAEKQEAAAQYGGTLAQQRDRSRDGSVLTVHYPWMEKRHLGRSQEVIDNVNEELKENIETPALRLGKSTLSPRVDMLGMFATRGVRKGECILVDRTATSAVSRPPSNAYCETCYDTLLSSPIPATCCKVLFCTTTCHTLAMTTYHRATCGHDFSYISDPASELEENASPMRPLLTLRFLALSVAAGPSSHPLDHPLVARLSPLANTGHLEAFTLAESIALPLAALEQMGVDIFGDARFGGTTLHTLWTRLANNKAGSFDEQLGFVDVVGPFLPLFNHSCEPGVEYTREEGTSTVRFFAIRDIEVGEEVFDGYLDVEGLERGERVKRLWPWFGRECLCGRCERERGG